MDDFQAWYDTAWKTQARRHDETCSGGEDFQPCSGRKRSIHIDFSYMLPLMEELVRESGAYKKKDGKS